VLATEGGAHYLPVPPRPPLGVARTSDHMTFTTVELPQQWRMLLYTDGLLDRFRRPEPADDIGLAGLLEAVDRADRSSLGLPEWVARILAASPQTVSDDVAVLALSCTGRR
jgi:Stage II sporulation protein E (SpoIIE)